MYTGTVFSESLGGCLTPLFRHLRRTRRATVFALAVTVINLTDIKPYAVVTPTVLASDADLGPVGICSTESGVTASMAPEFFAQVTLMPKQLLHNLNQQTF